MAGGRKKGSGPTPGSWQKGQCGNPKGRPKDFPGFREQCRKFAGKNLDRLNMLAEHPDPRVQLAAVELMLAYGFGKPVVGDTDPAGGQVTTVRFVHVEAPAIAAR